MITRARLVAGYLLIAGIAYGQSGPSWPCSSDLTRAEGDNKRIRISTGVSESLIQKKVLPDISDLRSTNEKSTIIIRTLVGKDGIVKCTDAAEGDANLFQRALDAAKQWRFKPFLLNGEPLIFETSIEFTFKKHKVTAR
jgi:hypothetical protein